MIALNESAQTILRSYIDRYVDYRRQGEYGTSSFWNWYYQIRNYIYQLDSSNYPVGNGLVYNMPYWGAIEYSRSIIDGEVYVLVNEFRFNTVNFYNWIRFNLLPPRIPTTSPTQSITSWEFDKHYKPYNGIYVVVSNNGLYSLADKQKNLKIDKWFESITFPQVANIQGYSTIGEGTSSPFHYLITSDLRVIHPAEAAITNRRKFEKRLSRIVIEVINQYLRKKLILN